MVEVGAKVVTAKLQASIDAQHRVQAAAKAAAAAVRTERPAPVETPK